MNATALWSFALIVGLLTVTPGLDTALVLRTAAAGQLASGVLLAVVHIAFGVVWSALLIGGARLFRRGLGRPSVRRRIDQLTGTVIAAFGVQLALSDASV